MSKIEDKIALMELYDLYQGLLTEKQKGYFEAAYFDDSSISEIADEFDVSRNAVHDQLKKTIAKLNDIEDAIRLRQSNRNVKTLLGTLKQQDTKEKMIKMIEEFEKVE